MSEIAPFATPPLGRRRQSKFTEANIRQITNLLEVGKRKEEIVETIDVTPATLQVTCSKLGHQPALSCFIRSTRTAATRFPTQGEA